MIHQELIQMLEQGTVRGEGFRVCGSPDPALPLPGRFRVPPGHRLRRRPPSDQQTGQGMGGVVSPGRRDEIHECRHAPGVGAD